MQKNDYVTKCAAGLAIAVPLLLILGRAVADIAMILTGIVFLAHSFRRKDWSWWKMPWFKVALLTWAYLLLSAVMADFDVKGALVQAGAWIRFPLFAMAFSVWLAQDAFTKKHLLPSLSVLLVLVAVDTIWQFVFGISLSGHPDPNYPGRMTGPFDRLVVGVFLLRMSWPAIGYMFGRVIAKNRALKPLLLAIAFTGLMGITILISGERMAFALFGLCALVFAAFAVQLRIWLFSIGALGAVAAVALVFSVPQLHQRIVTATLPYLENVDKSPYGAVWANGLAAWRHSPVFGVGPNNFVPACETLGFEGGFRNELAYIKKLTCVRHPHNIYIEWMAEAGIIGLMLFLMLIGAWINHMRQQWRNPHQDLPDYYRHLGYGLSLLSFLWPFTSSMSFFTNWNAVLFWWILALAMQKRSS